jgi:D-apionolactonase
MRHNPYGADVAANPAHGRLPAAGDDPRHGALFGAAFATGVAAHAAAAGVDRLILAAPTGRFGLVNGAGARHPLQAIHAELAKAAGAERHAVTFDRPGLAALAFRTGAAIRILVANLTAAEIPLILPDSVGAVGLLDETAGWSKPPTGRTILGPYRAILFSTR